MEKWFFQIPTVYCPVCKTSKEISDHFLTCQRYPSLSDTNKTELSKLIDKYRIDPYLKILIFRVITCTPCDTASLLQSYPTYPVTDYEIILRSQNSICWLNFIKGFPIIHWRTHQQRYIKEMFLPKKSTNSLWLQKV